MLKSLQKYILPGFCIGILFLFMIAICRINFSFEPSHYSTDMYTDMRYALQAWEKKSIFPEGWVFGNQLYAVATPVLSAFFYGICGSMNLSMGLASTVMGIFVIFSFCWLLRAFIPRFRGQLLAITLFMTASLIFGGPFRETNGWQLFFTMSSFYACYAICAFLAFGCYIRGKWEKKQLFPLILCVFLSFGTGLQSLRQTLIMALPIMAVELLCILYRVYHKQALFTFRTVVAAVVFVSNLLGVVTAKLLQIPQVEIFGKITITGLQTPILSLQQSFANALSLVGLGNKSPALILAIMAIFGILCLAYRLQENAESGSLCLLLLTVSLVGVLMLDAFTTMHIRSIYYFLLYPLLGTVGAVLYSHFGKWVRYGACLLLVVSLLSGAEEKLQPVFEPTSSPDRYDAVVAYLEEQGIDTVYSGWNRGERIGIASDGRIRCGFWDAPKTPFVPVKYLCDPEVFDAEPENCAYVFLNSSEANTAIEAAKEKGTKLKLLKHFPEVSIYIYIADVNLIGK
ncbi:MAG: hypothetical protein E7453_08185 [Ruminococcaceae bacterium]|nr:hypothetical protein [Oscillospiraceae bacterium]